MAVIVTRAGKGSPLTNAEVDANFTNLNTEVGNKADQSSLTTAVSDLNSSMAEREPTIPAGTTSQFLRGDKTWQEIELPDEATTSVSGLLSAADKTKLNSIAASATANDTDANLKNRANHTGEQAISTVTGLQGALDAKAADNAVVKLTGAQTVAGVKTFSDGINVAGKINNSPAHREAATNLGAGVGIDLAAGTDFFRSVSANTTFAFSNVGAAGGLAQAASLIVAHTGGTITFSGATVKWAGGSAPTLTTGRVHQFFFWPDPITNQVLISVVSYY